jgi:hypothetical protein
VRQEKISQRENLLVIRSVLEPGESTPWHIDSYHRFTLVVRGDLLALEFRDPRAVQTVPVHPGLAEWDSPTDRVHRAVNVGQQAYEQISVFFLDRPDSIPQPTAE